MIETIKCGNRCEKNRDSPIGEGDFIKREPHQPEGQSISGQQMFHEMLPLQYYVIALRDAAKQHPDREMLRLDADSQLAFVPGQFN
jgi:hypothetical protein